MLKIVFYLLLCYVYANALEFGTIMTNAIVLNVNLEDIDKEIVQKNHTEILRSAKDEMSDQIGRDELKLKIFHHNDTDYVIENSIIDSVKTILQNTQDEEDAQNEENIEDNFSMGKFLQIKNNSKNLTSYNPINTMIALIRNIKHHYGEDNNIPKVAFYKKNGEEDYKVPLRAIFAIAYKIINKYGERYLEISVIYSNTNIQKTKNGEESLILQELKQKIDISSNDTSAFVLGNLYGVLRQKISNLITEELRNE